MNWLVSDCLIGELFQTFKGTIVLIPDKLFHWKAWKEHFPNTFYQASITPVTKSSKDIIRKKLHTKTVTFTFPLWLWAKHRNVNSHHMIQNLLKDLAHTAKQGKGMKDIQIGERAKISI